MGPCFIGERETVPQILRRQMAQHFEDKMTTNTTPRPCGECTLCCRLIGIDKCDDGGSSDFPFDKPADTNCKHCRPGHGCEIFGTELLPRLCKTYSWHGLDPLQSIHQPALESAVGFNQEDRGVQLQCEPSLTNQLTITQNGSPVLYQFAHFVV